MAERLNLATQSAGIGIWDWDILKNEIVWDEQMVALYGLQPDGFKGAYEAWLNGVYPDDREESNRISERAVRGECEYNTEFRVLWPDGSVHWLKADGTVFRDSNGTPVRMIGVNYDITERKQTDEKLGKLAERLNLATRSASIGIWDWDVQKNELIWDEQMVALYGLQPDGFKGAYEAWLNGVHPDDREESNNVTQSALRGEKEYNTEFRVLWPDGSVHWLKADGTVFYDANRTPVRMIGVNYDITERKQSEKNLKRWADTFENVAFGFVIGEPGNNTLGLMNPAFASMHGYTKDELTGLPIAGVFAPDERKELPTQLELVHKKGHHTWESWHIRKDGTIFPVLIDASLVKNESGKALYRIVTVQDITERKLAEQKLRESENRYTTLFRESNIPVVLIKLPEVRIADVNKAVEILTGYSREELIGKNSAEIGIISHSQRTETISKFEEKGAITRNLMRIKTKSGDERIINVNTNPVELNGEHYAFTSIHDITERVIAENRLLDSEERYRKLAGNFPDTTITFYNRDFRVTFVTGRELHNAGRNATDFIGKRYDEILIPSLATEARKSFEKAFGGEINTFESKSFGDRFIKVIAVPVYDSEGTINEIQVISQNITESKKAEQERLISEQKYTLLFESSGTPSLVFNMPEGIISEVNRKVEEFTGYSREELIGKNSIQAGIVMPEYRSKVIEILSKNEILNDFELLVKAKNGEIKTVLVNAVHFNIDENHYIITTWFDISDRKKAEQKLRESEQKLKLFVEYAPAAIAMFDTDMRYIAVSKRYLTDYGLKEVSINGLSHYEVFPEIGEEWKSVHRRCLAGATEIMEKDRFQRADGTIDWVHWEIHPWFLEEGKIGGIILFSELITEQVNAKIDLENSESKFRSIAENLSDVITITDENGVISYISPATSGVFGYESWEMNGKNFNEFLASEDRERLLNIYKTNIRLGVTGQNLLVKAIRKNGEKFYAEISAGRIIEDKGIKGRLALIRDVTEIRLSEIRERNRSRILQMLTEKFSLEEVLYEIQLSIEEEEPESICTILLTDKTGKQLLSAIRNQLPDFYNESINGIEIGLGMGSCGTAAFTKESVFVEDILTHPYWESFKELAHKAGVSACWSKPVISFDGQVLGTFAIYSRKVRLPNDADIARIDYAANLTRLAIEKKSGEEQLRESESKFKAVFDNAPVGISLIDQNRSLLESNNMLANIIQMDEAGLKKGDFRLRKYIREDGSELPENELASARVVAEHRPVRNVVKGIKLENGETIWTQVSAAPLASGDSRYVVITQDITDRKKVLDALAENERQLRKTIETTSDGFWIVDSTRRFIEVNEAYCKMSGYSKEEILKMNISDIEAIETKEITEERILKISTEGSDRFETQHRRKDGSVFDVEVSVNVLDFEQGQMICFCRDITERKKAEKQLRENEAELNHAMDLAKMASWHVDLSDYSLTVSENYKRVFEIDDENIEITFNYFISRIHPDDVALMNVESYQFSPGSPPVVFDFRMLNPDGTVRWLQNTMVGEFSDGKLVALKGTNIDITEKKNNEQEILELNSNLERKVEERTIQLKRANEELIKARDAADEANKAKSQFLANMSHEIRTPLNSIIGFSELLVNSSIDEKKRSQVLSIRNSGRSLLNIINDILDLSKVEAGKIIIEAEPLNVYKIVNEVGGMFEQKANEKNLAITIESETNLTAPLMLDETRLRQILFNIMGNAIKFTKTGGVSVIINHEEKNNDLVDLKITVADTGIGIPESQISAIFEPFVQQTGQVQKTYGGTGLGLAISRRMAEAMGGEISVKSVPGVGSEFTIYLKNVVKTKNQTGEKENKADFFSSIRFDNKTILIVDDIPDNRILLVDILEETGARLLEAENGQEAVEIASKEIPDLILMDIRMPVLDGLEACRILKTKPETAKIPCVAVSASIKLGKSGKEIPENFEDNIMKPFAFEELFEVMIRFLKQTDEKGKMVQRESGTTEQDKEWPDDLKIYAKQELVPLLNHVMHTQLVDDMEGFGKLLIQTGQRFENQMLIGLGKKITGYADLFDVDKLTKILNEFRFVLNSNLK